MTKTKKYLETKYLKLASGWSHEYFLPAGIQNMPISFTVGEYRLYPSIPGDALKSQSTKK